MWIGTVALRMRFSWFLRTASFNKFQQVSATAYTSLKLNSSSEVHLSRNLHTCPKHGGTTNPTTLTRAPLMLLLLTLLEHLLHNLLLLDQKRPDHPILDAIRTSRSSVRALDGFLGLGDVGVFAGPEGGDLLCLWNTLAPHLPRIYILPMQV